MTIWTSFQRKIAKQDSSEVGLKLTLLADVLSSGSGSLQHQHMPFLPQQPIDSRQTLYGGERFDS